MKKNILVSIAVALVVLLVANVGVGFASGSSWDYPRIDTLYEVIAYPYTYSLEKAKACEMDTYYSAIRTVEVETLKNPPYGWSVSMNPGFHMCYLGPNCRPYTPESSGKWWNYHGRTPGFPLYPLNISQFRLALELMVGCLKDTWLPEIFGYINVRLDQCVPPANEFWFNPYIPPYPYNFELAEQVLLGAGFQWDYGPDGMPHTTDDKWVCPNGMVLWDGTRTGPWKSDRYAGYITAPGEDAYGFWVMPPGTGLAPTSYEIAMRHARQWNKFFCGVEDVKPASTTGPNYLFMDDATNSYDQLIRVPFYNRDHDLYFLCWGLGREPDYLYDFFCSDVDIEGGDNSPGLKHDGLDRCLRTIKFWKFKDWELLDVNNGPETSIVIPAGKEYGPFGPFESQVSVKVQIEHVSLGLGVYDEELVEGTHFTLTWSTDPYGRFWVKIKTKTGITLNMGEALEAKFPACTYHRLITDIEEMRKIVYLVQWKLYYLMPYLPIYSRNYINLYKPGVEGWVDSRGYGSAPSTLKWGFSHLWKEGGVLYEHDSGAPSTLNPITASWVYEIQVLGRIFDGLISVDPYTHEDIPWIATRWEMEPWSSPGEGVENGMIIRFWIRNDVYWQDGDHVTAEDIAWNFEFLESLTPPEYEPIWNYLVRYNVVHDYLIELYVNATGYWKLLEFAGSALQFPRTAWQDYMGDYNSTTITDYENAIAYKPWTVPHPNPPPDKPQLTMLYGTGPYWFEWWDPTIGKGLIKLNKNNGYWVRAAGLPDGQVGALNVRCKENKITKTKGLEIILQNFNAFEMCSMDYKVEITDSKGTTWVAASGAVANLPPYGVWRGTPEIKDWAKIAFCNCAVKLYIKPVGAADWRLAYALDSKYAVGDTDCNNKVDGVDMWRVAKDFGKIGLPICHPTDLDVNTKVDGVDMWIAAKQFGKTC